MTASRLPLFGVLLVFLLVRLPAMYLAPAGEDEDCYAVPGLTILENGVPRLPHVPARNRDAVYYRADQGLYAEPPLYFYWQSAFYAIFPKTLGTARLSSAVAGLLVLAAVFRIARWCNVGTLAATAGCLALSLSRWFFFPATRTRPDILCALFGLIAILLMTRWLERRRRRDLCSLGIAIGLGGLCHPIAIVYAVQIAVWIGLSTTGWKRLTAPGLVAAIALLTTTLWLPLIALAPEVFEVQFRNQFLAVAGESASSGLSRLAEAFVYHGASVWWFIGPIQCVLCVASLAFCLIVRDSQAPRLRTLALLSVTGFFLTAAVVGSHHRIFGYFLYPAALTFPLLARILERAASSLLRTGIRETTWQWRGATILVALLLPGSGLRPFWMYARHGNEVEYNAPAFARVLMEHIPADAVCIVDPAYAVEFVAHGRPTLLAEIRPKVFPVQNERADYLVIGRQSIRDDVLRLFDAELTFSAGRQEDLNTCFAQIYKVR